MSFVVLGHNLKPFIYLRAVCGITLSYRFSYITWKETTLDITNIWFRLLYPSLKLSLFSNLFFVVKDKSKSYIICNWQNLYSIFITNVQNLDNSKVLKHTNAYKKIFEIFLKVRKIVTGLISHLFVKIMSNRKKENLDPY